MFWPVDKTTGKQSNNLLLQATSRGPRLADGMTGRLRWGVGRRDLFMKQEAEKTRGRPCNRGGLESKLDLAAVVVIAVGIAFGIAVLFGTGFTVVLPAVCMVAGAWIAWVVLRGLAEIVRLQKRANGLPYSGRISETEEGRLIQCPACDASYFVAVGDPDTCPHCDGKVAE